MFSSMNYVNQSRVQPVPILEKMAKNPGDHITEKLFAKIEDESPSLFGMWRFHGGIHVSSPADSAANLHCKKRIKGNSGRPLTTFLFKETLQQLKKNSLNLLSS